MAQFLIQGSEHIDLKNILIQKSVGLLQGHSSQNLEIKLKETNDLLVFSELILKALDNQKPKAIFVVNICDILVHYLRQLQKQDIISQLVDIYCKLDFQFNLKLKLLSNLVNIMNDENSIKTKAILQIFTISIQNNKFSQLYIALQNSKQILLDLKVQERRIIYSKLYKCQILENPKLTLDFAIEFLQQFEESSEEELTQYKVDILDAVKKVITSEQYSYNFGNILNFKSIQFLNNQNQQLQILLKIFVESDLQQYLEYKKSNQSYLDHLEIDQDKFLSRLRVSCFVHLADQHKRVHFQDVAQYLQVERDEVEDWVINAFENKTVNGKIDQLEEIVEFQGNQGNYFDKSDWEKLKVQLEDMEKNLQKNIDILKSKS